MQRCTEETAEAGAQMGVSNVQKGSGMVQGLGATMKGGRGMQIKRQKAPAGG